MKVDYVQSDQFSIYVDLGDGKQKLTPNEAVEFRDKLDKVIRKYDCEKSIKNCQWCGEVTKKKGKVLKLYFHEDCIESIKNGAGVC